MRESRSGYEKLLAGACATLGQGEAVFELALPEVTAVPVPVIYNSPHSGRFYPKDLMDLTILDENMIRGSEDCFVDLLFAAAPQLGAPLLKALYPRAYVDTNREPFELDPEMFEGPIPGFVNKNSQRILAGLGTIPKLVAPDRHIYRGKISFAGAMARIEQVYIPYHRALAALLEHMKITFGGAVMIDCHSMPSLWPALGPSSGQSVGASWQGGADIILGDRFGQSCASWLSDIAEGLFQDLGYSVGRNEPYAGGYNALHYGRPAEGRHVLQVEISRRLYLDEASLIASGNFSKLAGDLKAWMAAMHDQVVERATELAFRSPVPKAAE